MDPPRKVLETRDSTTVDSILEIAGLQNGKSQKLQEGRIAELQNGRLRNGGWHVAGTAGLKVAVLDPPCSLQSSATILQSDLQSDLQFAICNLQSHSLHPCRSRDLAVW
jgi:hypothetical protein